MRASHESPGQLLKRHGLHPKKSWGQNFLSDPDIQRQIAALPGATADDWVVEFGAGLGHLTVHLLETGAHVVAVERDRDLAPILRAELGVKYPRLEVIEADATTFDLAPIAARAGKKLLVTGNLPYHLGSQILFSILDQRAHVKRFVALLQKEVVERIVAEPDTDEYGVLSVLLQEFWDVELALRVGPRAFVPPPAVDSAVLVADILDAPRAPIDNEWRYRALAKASFLQRRKTLSNALKPVVPDRAMLDSAAATALVDLRRRGETLSVGEFAMLERALAAAGHPAPPPKKRRQPRPMRVSDDATGPDIDDADDEA